MPIEIYPLEVILGSVYLAYASLDLMGNGKSDVYVT